jgi:DnaJ-class molecular chaperone
MCFSLIKIEYLNFRIIDPDKNPDPEAAAQFQAVDKAYKVLIDPKLRSTYDQLGPRGMKKCFISIQVFKKIELSHFFFLAADAMRRMNDGKNSYFFNASYLLNYLF